MIDTDILDAVQYDEQGNPIVIIQTPADAGEETLTEQV